MPTGQQQFCLQHLARQTHRELEHLEKQMVFCYKNCSSDREKLLKSEAEGREFAKFLRSLEQFIQNAFLTRSWRFLRSYKLDQLEFKLEKIIGI